MPGVSTPTNQSMQFVVGTSFEEELEQNVYYSSVKSPTAVSTCTTVEGDVSIDDSQMMMTMHNNHNMSTRTNRSTASSTAIDDILGKPPPTFHKLPVLNEQVTNSTASNSEEEHEEDDDSKYLPAFRTRNVASEPTRHTSNLYSSFSYKQRDKTAEALANVPDKSTHTTTSTMFEVDYKTMDDDTDQAAAWAIHFALIFFATLVATSLILSFVVIQQYGFITLLFMTLLLSFAIGLAWFIDANILSKNEKLKPIRNKIISNFDTFKSTLQEEVDNFQRDWNDFHLLLTNGGGDANDDDDDDNEEPQASKHTTTSKKRRKKSILFKMIKPILGVRRKLTKKKKNKKSTFVRPSTEMV